MPQPKAFKKRFAKVKKSNKKVVRPKGLRENVTKASTKAGKGYSELLKGAKKGRGMMFKGKKIYGG